MRTIKKVIIHCTDSDDSLDIGFREIDQWHKDRGWSGCGYHYIVRRNGSIEHGRPLDISGAHVKNHNSDSVGIVWVGRNQISSEQLKELKTLVKAICYNYNLDPTEDVFGHYEFDKHKTCPNLDMNKFRAELLFK